MLFQNLGVDPQQNLLPFDGVVQYHGVVWAPEEAQQLFERLMAEIDWRNDEAMMFGKHIITKRKVAWYGDKTFSYTYSKITKTALLWNDLLLALKAKTEAVTGEIYNSCLLNLYHDGSESMGWHSDGEKMLKKHGAIASLSFGAERKFAFKHRATKKTVQLPLEAGSILVMKGETQDHWVHRLPPTKKVLTPRINLTFRFIVDS